MIKKIIELCEKYKNIQVILISLFLLMVIIQHIFTLSLSPLPWFDEIAFTEITKNYQDIGKLLWPALNDTEEILAYGPIYFIAQSYITDVFGWGISQFRALNFVSSLIIVLIGAIALKKLNVSSGRYWMFVVFLSLDILFIQNSHSGRMDLFATSLVLTSVFIFLIRKDEKGKTTLIYPLIAGVVLAIAFLTTPRVIFFTGIFFGLFIVDTLEKRIKETYRYFIMCGIGFTTSYGIWIYSKFGSLFGFLEYYFGNPNISPHIGGFQLVRYVHQVPVLIALFFTIVLWVYNYRNLSYENKNIGMSVILTCILYFTLVTEAGPYIAMLMPLVYFFIFSSRFTLLFQKRLILALMLSVLAINISAYTLKTLVIITDYETRNAKYIDTFVENNIAPGSKVMADYTYFYSVIKNNSSYRSFPIQKIDDPEKYVVNFINNFPLDYLIVNHNSSSTNTTFYKELKKWCLFEKTIQIENQDSKNIVLEYLSKFGYKISSSYRGIAIKLSCNV